jgi:hypothetical protein
MSKLLSNQKIIDELHKITKDYINTQPKMLFKPFVSNKAEKEYNLGDNRGGKIGGFKSLGQHPFPGNNSQTLHPDPLYGGAMYKNYAEFINRGGAQLVQKIPLSGGMHEESDSDYLSSSSSSSSDSESDYETESESDYESEDEGGDIYNDYVKPVAKGAYEIGKEIIVPVGKELLKDAILGLMMGAGHKMEGGLSGTKQEFIHILKAMYPQIDFKKKTKAELLEEIKKAMKKMEEPSPRDTNIIVKKRGRRTKTQFTPADNIEMQRKVGNMFTKTKSEIAKQLKEDKKLIKPLLKKIKEKEPPKPRAPRKPRIAKEKAPPKQRAPTKKQLEAERIARDKKSRDVAKENKRLEKLDKDRLRIVVKRDNAEEKFKNAKNKTTKDKYEQIRDMLDAELSVFDMENNYKSPIVRNKEKLESRRQTNIINQTDGGKIKKIIGTKRGEKVRGDILAEYMKKHNVSLGVASKKVKELGLY